MSDIRIGLPGGRWVGLNPETLAVNVDQLTLDDIARGLGRVVRFAGHTPYSVAQHSVVLAKTFPDDEALQCAAKFHDTPECLGVGDVNTFIKRVFATELKRVEDAMFAAVWDRFAGKYREAYTPRAALAAIHQHDQWLGAAEAIHFGFAHTVPEASVPPPGWAGWKPRYVWTADEARRMWLVATPGQLYR